jgi:hypothetical protein
MIAISDEDLIECWFGRSNEPEIVKELGLHSTRELRLHWRRLKELGKLPLTSRVGIDGKFGQWPASAKCDLLLERLIKVHGKPQHT